MTRFQRELNGSLGPFWQKAAEKAQKYAEKHGTKRKASQNDINAFFG